MKHQKLMLALGMTLVLAACGDKAPKKDAAATDAPKAEAKADAAGGPAIIFDAGGKFDKSFNESGYNGAEMFKKETGKSYLDFELKNPAELEGVLRKMAQRGGNPIVTMGFNSGEALNKVAAELPKSNFVIIDSEVKQPNVKSIQFREEEGSFLVGALAAMASKSGKVGFIGGMDIPVIRKFSCGFEQGAKHINAKAEVIKNTVGTTGDAWNNPTKGGELAKAQFDRGVDVVFAAAGGTGNGVYQAAKDGKKYAIGVDSNQNYLFPGTMLTSMVKRVDNAVLAAFKEAAAGSFKAGSVSMGLAEGGVDWADDEHNKALVNDEMRTKVNAIKKDIIDGKIKITCDGK
jgi:basic membrane protein A